MIKITLAMHDHDFKILSKNTLRLIKKKTPTKAHRISHNNNDILVKCMKYKTVCISFKNFQL